MSCIFCQLASADLPNKILYQDDEVIAVRDIQPQAPVHILVIPREHIVALSDVTDEQMPLLGKMARVAKLLAENEGIKEKGFRIAVNCGQEGGQTVPHLHMHLIGGRQLSGRLG